MGFMDIIKLFESNTFLDEGLKKAKEMHTKTISMVEDSWTVVSKGDVRLAESVLERDNEIDELDVEIRKKVLSYLASMPTGGNVELSLILIDISTALERIADHAVWISETGIRTPPLKGGEYLEKLQRMKEIIVEIGKDIRTALGDADEEKAKKAIAKAGTVKRLRNEIIDGLRKEEKMPAKEAIAIWSVATNLDRIASYAKNIALTVTGPYAEAK